MVNEYDSESIHVFSDVVVLIGITSSHFENASTMIKNIFPSKGPPKSA